jgi:hypothetical protein
MKREEREEGRRKKEEGRRKKEKGKQIAVRSREQEERDRDGWREQDSVGGDAGAVGAGRRADPHLVGC